MNPNNFDKTDDQSTSGGGGAPAHMQGFPGGWNPGMMNPYFQGGWNPRMLNQGYMPLPFPPFPAAAAQNETTIATTVEIVGPAVNKESQNAGEGGSVPAAGGRRKGKVATTRNKGSNFSPMEDVFLVKSWVQTSIDSVIKTGQKKEALWERIMTRYNERRGPYPERTWRSLQSRWELIKPECSTFSGYMENVLRDNPSGMSDTDKTTLALANFADIEQYHFAFMHCWELLKDEPKWMEINHRGTRNGDDDGISDHIPPTSNTIDLEQLPSPPSTRAKRPIGMDAAKSAAKKAASSSAEDSSPYASKLQDLAIQKLTIWQEENLKKSSRYDQMAATESQRYEEFRMHNEELRKHNQHMKAIEEERLHLMCKKVDIQETHEDERILSILDDCHLQLRMFYEAKQAEIMQKIQARHNLG